MNPKPIIGAVIGAALGAVIWAAISYFTNHEIGIVAWAIGGLVGFGALVFDGRGKALAVICACLALVSIFAGKLFAVQFAGKGEIAKELQAQITPESYEAAKQEALVFSQLESEADIPKFMVEHQYTEATDPKSVTLEEVQYFNANSAGLLRAFHQNPPAFEQWKQYKKAQSEEMAAAILANISLIDVVVENLGPIDVIFALLGIATAYQMIARREEKVAALSPADGPPETPEQTAV